MGDWLGTGFVATFNRKHKPFLEAKKYVQKLKIKNQSGWYTYCKSGKRPNDIPSNPQKAYTNKGWNGLGDWLGTGRVASRNIKFKTFSESKEFIKKFKIKSKKEWMELYKQGKIPNSIPKTVYYKYKSEWKGWPDFLGNE